MFKRIKQWFKDHIDYTCTDYNWVMNRSGQYVRKWKHKYYFKFGGKKDE